MAFYHSTVQRLFQGVASTLLGPEAMNGGWSTALVGIGMHVAVAFGWSAVFLLLVIRLRRFRESARLAVWRGEVVAVYGPFVWMVMSFAVIPVLLHRPPSVGFRWWVQLVGHFPFVGLPIVAMSAWGSEDAGSSA